jgi:hypothetical protein
MDENIDRYLDDPSYEAEHHGVQRANQSGFLFFISWSMTIKQGMPISRTGDRTI